MLIVNEYKKSPAIDCRAFVIYNEEKHINEKNRENYQFSRFRQALIPTYHRLDSPRCKPSGKAMNESVHT